MKKHHKDFMEKNNYDIIVHEYQPRGHTIYKVCDKDEFIISRATTKEEAINEAIKSHETYIKENREFY